MTRSVPLSSRPGRALERAHHVSVAVARTLRTPASLHLALKEGNGVVHMAPSTVDNSARRHLLNPNRATVRKLDVERVRRLGDVAPRTHPEALDVAPREALRAYEVSYENTVVACPDAAGPNPVDGGPRDDSDRSTGNADADLGARCDDHPNTRHEDEGRQDGQGDDRRTGLHVDLSRRHLQQARRPGVSLT